MMNELVNEIASDMKINKGHIEKVLELLSEKIRCHL